jgi:hypothetical protein
MKIIVNDANILIDLVKLDILPHFFQLPFSFHTTDIIFEELDQEQQEMFLPFITNKQLIVENFTGEELLAMATLKEEKSQLSLEENLRNFAVTKAVIIRGHLWVLDMLFEHNVLQGTEVTQLLTTLQNDINPRLGLPQSACEELKQKWNNDEPTP